MCEFNFDNMEKVLEKETERLLKFMRLCKLLFGGTKDMPQVINELKPESEFYELAKGIADKDGISWDDMSDDDSNYIIMIMLNELYLAMGEFSKNVTLNVIERERKDGDGK